MSKKFFSLLALCAAAMLSACSSEPTVYDYSAVSNSGGTVDLSAYKGKVLLIVNTASKCGFTPQYEGLEALYKEYKDEGLVVLGFPCDQFGHQEPGTNEEIAEFCTLNYGVTFPIMDKVEVNGDNALPLFKFLYAHKGFAGFGDSDRGKMMDRMMSSRDPEYASNPDIKWNFTKFLVDKKGRVVARYEPTVSPEDLEDAIEALL